MMHDFQTKEAVSLMRQPLKSVGVAGFEPTTSCSQSRRDTGLRYTPSGVNKKFFQDPTFGSGSGRQPSRQGRDAIPGYATPRVVFLLKGVQVYEKM